MPASRYRPQVRHAISRYREARQSLRSPEARHSRRGLDWMNFFIADVQTGFGTFVAFYLAELGWSKETVGLALTAGKLAGVIGQIPGGALADAVPWKRGLAASGLLMLCGAALLLALAPTSILVFIAEVLHGLTSAVLTPAIAAISLGLVGRRGMSARTGRNYRFEAAGNTLTSGGMGLVGTYLSKTGIFLAAAALCIPALVALSFIRGEEIDYARARNAEKGSQSREFKRVLDVIEDHRLLFFAACLVLFQLADASMLPLVGENIGASKGGSAIMMSGLIATPQFVVAVLSPWVGYHSEKKGRKPLLLIAFGVEAIRAAVFARFTAYGFLIAGQVLDGVSGAIVNVLTVLVITDLTAGSGRFNFARGFIGTLSGIAASVSTTASGVLFQRFGHLAGFFTLAVLASAATAVCWAFLPETKPEQYPD